MRQVRGIAVKRILQGFVALGVAGLLVAGAGVSPVQAADSLVAAKRATTVRIDKRLTALRAMDARVSAADRLTDAHRGELRKLLAGDITGLTTLRGTVQSEATAQAVRADARDMVEDYRVYMLVRPQVHVCVAADASNAALARLRHAYDSLSAALAAGRQNDAAAEQIAALKVNLDAAEAALTGTADTLLAVGPGPDEAAIKQQVSAARTKIHTARKNLRQAAAHAKRANDLLHTATK